MKLYNHFNRANFCDLHFSATNGSAASSEIVKKDKAPLPAHNLRTLLFLASLMLNLSGCGPTQGFVADTVNKEKPNNPGEPENPGLGPDPENPSEILKPNCETSPIAYQFNAQIIGAQVSSGASLQFGFDVGGFFKAIDLSVQVSAGRMDIDLELIDKLDPKTPLLNVGGHARFYDGELKGTIAPQLFKGGLGVYRQTPIAKLTEKSLKNGFKNALERFSKIDTGWISHVIKIIDPSEIIIPVGTVAGLRMGDEFKIFNVNHTWENEPCTSRLLSTRKTTESDHPIAIAQVSGLLANFATLKISSADPKEPIELGAQVEISNLPFKDKKEKKRTLLRSATIGDVSALGELVFEDATEIDLVGYLKVQMAELVSNYGFYFTK